MELGFELYKEMSRKAGISEGKLTDEYMFTLHVANLFFFENNIGVSDIQDGFVDGKSDGGIDFIFTNDDTFAILQGKSSSSIKKDDVINAVDKVIRTINDFKSGNDQKFNNKLVSAYLNGIDAVSEDATIKIIVCTQTLISETQKESIYEIFKTQEYSNYECIIYDGDDIDEKQQILSMEDEYVKEGRLKLSEPNNYLTYKEADYTGYVVNIKASSLKNLYKKHNGKGLFSYNLREHISNKSVDSGIMNTIKKERKNFWFYNNGITIACADCRIDGYMCKLYNFSVINGAQTTTKIGESSIVNSEKDFSVVCKIVVVGHLGESIKFVGNISQASNSQKPIIPRDLKANTREQRDLQRGAASNKKPLAIQIKRGLRAPNFKKVEKNQRVKNDVIGQLILGCILQRPGTARSGKRKIFETQKLYNQIFKRNMDYDTLADLVKLSQYYDEFKVEFTNNEVDVGLIAVCGNGKFVILAIIIFLIKKERGIIIDSKDANLEKDNIIGTLIDNYKGNDFEVELFRIFKFFTKKLNDIYEFKKDSMKLTSYSNFFKTDKTYQKEILSEIEKRVCDDEFDADRIKKYMKIFDI